MRTTLSVLFSLFCFLINAQNIKPINGYLKFNYIFTSGYWVYEDTVSSNRDSVTIVGFSTGLTRLDPWTAPNEEFFLVDYYSYFFGINYNDYFSHGWYYKRNGGGVYGQFGQPIMMTQLSGPAAIGDYFNGCEMVNFHDTLHINGVAHLNVVQTRIFASQQYQHEFNYDSDLYFSPGVGVVRKTYTDSSGVNHIWDLVKWQNDNSTIGLNEYDNVNSVLVYPNPTHGKLKIGIKNIYKIELIGVDGSNYYQSDENNYSGEIDISNLPDGIYFIKVQTAGHTYFKKIVKN